MEIEKLIANIRPYLLEKDELDRYDPLGYYLTSLLFDLRTEAEHFLSASTSSKLKLHWAPYALLSGALSLDEVNAKRTEKGSEIVALGKSKCFGISNLDMVTYSVELVNPNTLETIRDPRIIKIVNRNKEELSCGDFVGKVYCGPHARPELK